VSCSLDDVLAVLPPGTDCSYNELIERLKSAGRPTSGVGSVLRPFRESEMLALPSDRREPYGELRAWMRDRVWDDEVEGGWIAVALWVARRPAEEAPA
jgi:hypothetical protein